MIKTIKVGIPGFCSSFTFADSHAQIIFMIDQHKENILKDGFTIIELGNASFIESMQNDLLLFTNNFLGSSLKVKKLENLHHELPIESLNEFRLKVIKLINQNQDFRKNLTDTILPHFQHLLGPDLAIQKNINLVISLPGDVTSQIPMHSDMWTGHSPFELNLWVPFTKTYKTQSMFIMPLDKWILRKEEFKNSKNTLQELTKLWEKDFVFVEVDPGQALIFWHNLPHGNCTNQETISRLAVNVRIKNLYTPYGDKGLGDYFIPLTYGPMTELIFKAKTQWD
ncbi:MAG: phytanoyl-CoA dioxygenase family protein [Bacteriovorax sp.]|nr:phytanoyl-CoA dioxygenase family protein [Bacteriovorax sp.]